MSEERLLCLLACSHPRREWAWHSRLMRGAGGVGYYSGNDKVGFGLRASVDGFGLQWGEFEVLTFETRPQSFGVGTLELGTTCQTM